MSRRVQDFIVIVMLAVLLQGCATGPRLNPDVPVERAKMVDGYLDDFCSGALRDERVGLGSSKTWS